MKARFLPSRPSLIERLEARIAPATLFVGKVSNFSITADTGAPGLSSGDTVTFTPDAGTGSAHTATTGLIFGTRAFTDIPAAITTAVNGDVIRVATGTFTGPFVVNENLTFLGNQAGDDARSGRTNAANESVLNLTASALSVNSSSTFDGFQFNTGSSVAQGVKSSVGADQWINNIFSGGFGIELRTVNPAGTRFEHNRIDVTGTGISVPAQLSNTTIEENEILADVVGIDLQPTAGGANNQILNNFIQGPGSSGIGLRVGAALPATGALIVRGNFIQGFATGAHLLGNLPVAATFRANFLAGNTKAIDYDGALPIDAPFNFFGGAADTAAEVDALVDGPVNFAPFALTISGVDGIADRNGNDDDGFQPRLELGFTFAGKKFSYQDLDGDTVTVMVTKGDLGTDYALALDPGNVGTGMMLGELAANGVAAAGGDITISVVRGPSGDGFADVGRIESGTDLGKVIVRGDLGSIDVGDATPETPALKLLQAQSMGRSGLEPLPGTVTGRILSMRVLGDYSANLSLSGAAGSINSLFIGGSIAGLDGLSNTGRLVLSQGLLTASILGGVRASDVANTGVLDVGGSLGTLTIGGALGGGNASVGPIIHVGGSAKTIHIKGGMPAVRGLLDVDGSLDNLILGGDLLGICDVGGSTKKVSITGNVGQAGATLGILQMGGSGGAITIGGSVNGGQVRVEGSATSIIVRGDVNGALDSILDGEVTVNGSVGKLLVGGSIFGGSSFGDGSVSVGGFTGSATIGGSIVGGTGSNTGQLSLDGGAGTVTIAGSIVGSLGNDSGLLEIDGNVKSVTLRGSIFGGDDSEAGSISIFGIAQTVFVGGSIFGGTDAFAGEVQIRKAGTVTIAGGVIGGTEVFSGFLTIFEGVSSLKILGDVIANANTARVIDIGGISGAVFIGGDVVGDGRSNTITFNGFAAPADQAASVVLKSLTIRGSVSDARIEFGSNNGFADVSAGTISIGGDFRRSAIALGVNDAGDNILGTDDDTMFDSGGSATIRASLGKLIIGGAVAGNPFSLTDRGSILAQAIASIVIGGQTIPLTAGLDDFLLGPGLDVRVRELA